MLTPFARGVGCEGDYCRQIRGVQVRRSCTIVELWDSAMKKFGGENLDVLQNIEFSIVEVYRADRSLLDFDVKDALDALVRHFRAEEEGRTPPAMNLGDRARRVFASVQGICEWRLGRSPFPGDTAMPESAIPVSVLVQCLRQIQKSVPLWSQQGGRRGYLDFVSQYVP